MSFQIDNKNKSFCLAPWIHSYLSPSGKRSVCCVYNKTIGRKQERLKEIWNSEEYKDIRLKMIRGEEIPECSRCPIHSQQDTYREYWNSIFSHYKKSVLKNTKEDGYLTSLPVSIDYRTSQCNFKCKMCNHRFSSSIFHEEFRQKNGKGMDIEIINQYKEEFIEIQDKMIIEEVKMIAPDLQEIYFAGGEPLISENHWEIISYLKGTGYSKNIHLRYTTNLSKIEYRKHKLKEILPFFKKVELYVSIDGTSDYGEWIRTGFNYPKFNSNIESLNNISDNLHIYFMVSCSLPTLLDLPNINYLANHYGFEIKIQDVVGTTKLLMIKDWPFDVINPLIQDTIQVLKRQNYPNSNVLINYLSEEYSKDKFRQTDIEELQKSRKEILDLDKMRTHKNIKFKNILQSYPSLIAFYENIILDNNVI